MGFAIVTCCLQLHMHAIRAYLVSSPTFVGDRRHCTYEFAVWFTTVLFENDGVSFFFQRFGAIPLFCASSRVPYVLNPTAYSGVHTMRGASVSARTITPLALALGQYLFRMRLFTASYIEVSPCSTMDERFVHGGVPRQRALELRPEPELQCWVGGLVDCRPARSKSRPVFAPSRRRSRRPRTLPSSQNPHR